MWKKLLSVLGFIGILIVASIGGQIGKGVGHAALSLSKPGPQEIEATLIEGFMRAAEQYNRTLPMMVDQDTRLETATVGPGP